MIFRQVTHDDLGCASYLIGDEKAGVAAVVDPKLDVEEYLNLAAFLDVSITDVLETHTHADHVSGHGRLAVATGATVHVHRDADARYPHEPFDDGWTLEVGAVRLRALHTPGHRPEHTAFAVIDTARAAEPWAVLTGDTLFVGDVARPDLAVDKRDGARGIFRSLHDRLLTLPDSVEVWPGHLGGSMCGGPGMSLKVASSIGYEREHNELLAVGDQEEFVLRTTDSLGPQPPNFEAIVEANRGPVSDPDRRSRPLTVEQVDALVAGGALVADVRTETEYDEAHVPGAVAITALRAGFGTKLAWLATPDRPVVLVGRDDADAERAAALAAAVGVAIAGHLAGGMTAWRAGRRPVERVERVAVGELGALMREEPEVQLLDVREDAEWRAGHVPGSAHAPYHDLAALPAGLDRTRPVAVICASGQRAAVATGLLARLGVPRTIHVTGGGVPALAGIGWQLERDPDRVE